MIIGPLSARAMTMKPSEPLSFFNPSKAKAGQGRSGRMVRPERKDIHHDGRYDHDIRYSGQAAGNGGSPEYRAALREGHRLINRARQAYREMKRAPMYIGGGYDEDGDLIPVENIGPFDRFEEACRDVEMNQMACRILDAQGIKDIGDRSIIPV